MAPSVPSVNRYIRAREVTIAYGYDRDRLHVTLRSAETLLATVMEGIPESEGGPMKPGTGVFIVCEDEAAIAGAWMPASTARLWIEVSHVLLMFICTSGRHSYCARSLAIVGSCGPKEPVDGGRHVCTSLSIPFDPNDLPEGDHLPTLQGIVSGNRVGNCPFCCVLSWGCQVHLCCYCCVQAACMIVFVVCPPPPLSLLHGCRPSRGLSTLVWTRWWSAAPRAQFATKTSCTSAPLLGMGTARTRVE